MAIILKANKVNLFVSSVLFAFWYHSPNILDTPRRMGDTSECLYIKTNDISLNTLPADSSITL
jgi:hypothetical protein